MDVLSIHEPDIIDPSKAYKAILKKPINWSEPLRLDNFNLHMIYSREPFLANSLSYSSGGR